MRKKIEELESVLEQIRNVNHEVTTLKLNKSDKELIKSKLAELRNLYIHQTDIMESMKRFLNLSKFTAAFKLREIEKSMAHE